MSAVLGEVVADVTIEVGNGQTVVAAVTCGSADRMGLSEGHWFPVVLSTRTVWMAGVLGAPHGATKPASRAVGGAELDAQLDGVCCPSAR